MSLIVTDALEYYKAKEGNSLANYHRCATDDSSLLPKKATQ